MKIGKIGNNTKNRSNFWSYSFLASSVETEGHYTPAGRVVNPLELLPTVWKRGQKGTVMFLPTTSTPRQEERGRTVNGFCQTAGEVLGGSPGEVGLLGRLPIKTLPRISPASVGAAAHPAARGGPGGGAVKAARAGAGFSPGRGFGRVWIRWWFLPAGLAAASSACSPVWPSKGEPKSVLWLSSRKKPWENSNVTSQKRACLHLW